MKKQDGRFGSIQFNPVVVHAQNCLVYTDITRPDFCENIQGVENVHGDAVVLALSSPFKVHHISLYMTYG